MGLWVRGAQERWSNAALAPCSADEDGRLKAWRLLRGGRAPQLALLAAHAEAHPGGIRHLAHHAPSGQLATAGGDGCVRVWRAASLLARQPPGAGGGRPHGALRCSFHGHSGQVISCGFDQAGERLVSCSMGDGTVRLWQCGTKCVGRGGWVPACVCVLTALAPSPLPPPPHHVQGGAGGAGPARVISMLYAWLPHGHAGG